MQTAILIVGSGILAVIAYGDMRSRRIPNVLSLAIATGAQAFSGGLNTWFQAVSTSIAGLNSTIPGP